jgi:hypothetical protein
VHPEEWRDFWDYIRWFSQKRNEIPDATDTTIVNAFNYGSTNEALIHEFGRGRPRTTADLLNIATKYGLEYGHVLFVDLCPLDFYLEPRAGPRAQSRTCAP